MNIAFKHIARSTRRKGLGRQVKRWPVALGCLLLALAGCGSPHESSISGKVTIDGKPLATGTVTFHPLGGGAAAYGLIRPDGEYAISTGAEKGLAAGEYAVTVVATTPPAPGHDFGELLASAQYGTVERTPLRATVKPGINRIDFDLKSS